MPDIDTRLLRSFVAVAKEESFSAAAAMLGCSQGAMSLRIRSLESRLGVGLLVRGGRGVRLTPAGRTLLADAGEIVELHDRLFDRASPRRIAGSVPARLRGEGLPSRGQVFKLPDPGFLLGKGDAT